VDVVRDLLDQQVIDGNGREIGRVDGIVVQVRDGEPPLLRSFLIGSTVLGDRLHPTVSRWCAALERALGIADRRPIEIRLSEIVEVDHEVKVRATSHEVAADAVEQRLRPWLAKIPGGR
jgi:sporulation protein YlmC with PRC-barrel domain